MSNISNFNSPEARARRIEDTVKNSPWVSIKADAQAVDLPKKGMYYQGKVAKVAKFSKDMGEFINTMAEEDTFYRRYDKSTPYQTPEDQTKFADSGLFADFQKQLEYSYGFDY